MEVISAIYTVVSAQLGRLYSASYSENLGLASLGIEVGSGVASLEALRDQGLGRIKDLT